MNHHRLATRVSRLVMIGCFLIGMAALARAAIDRTPNGQFGAIYKATPSTLVDGDFDSLHTDSSHNLLVAVSPGPSPVTTSPTRYGETASNGASAVTLVTNSGSKVIVPWMMTIINTDTVNHKVQILSSGGNVLWSFVLVSSTGAAVYDGASDGYSIRTVSNENLQIVMPNFVAEGGVAGSVYSVGYTTQQ